MDVQKLIVLFFGGAGIISLAGGLALSLVGKQVPDSVIALGAAGFSALATYLVQPREPLAPDVAGRSVTVEATRVTKVNDAGDTGDEVVDAAARALGK